jgi:hypothetical protein
MRASASAEEDAAGRVRAVVLAIRAYFNTKMPGVPRKFVG